MLTIEEVVVYTDGAARGNPGPSASGYMVFDGPKKIGEAFSYNGKQTNNFAEYKAIIMALEWCAANLKSPQNLKVTLISDSQLVVRQLNDEYKTKVPMLLKMKHDVLKLMWRFKLVVFENRPRENPYIKSVDNELNKLLDEILTKDL